MSKRKRKPSDKKRIKFFELFYKTAQKRLTKTWLSNKIIKLSESGNVIAG